MAKSLLFLPAAERDMRDIWFYTAEHWGIDQAKRYTNEIMDVCHALASGLKQGRPVDACPGYLKYLSGSHVVYFRDSGNSLEIVRVLHGRMDAPSRLLN